MPSRGDSSVAPQWLGRISASSRVNASFKKELNFLEEARAGQRTGEFEAL
jgi:hypothetical protein